MKTLWFVVRKILYYIMYFIFAILTYSALFLMLASYIENAEIAYKIGRTLLFAFVLLMASLFYKLFVKPRKKDK